MQRLRNLPHCHPSFFALSAVNHPGQGSEE